MVDVIKNGLRQINYGTGSEVSDETIAHAKEPLQIEWLTDSFVRISETISSVELSPASLPNSYSRLPATLFVDSILQAFAGFELGLRGCSNRHWLARVRVTPIGRFPPGC